MGYQKVLVPVSGKHHLQRAARALEHALRLLEEGGEICFLHCLTEVPYLLSGEDHKKLVMGDSREAEKLLGPLVERVRDAGITYSVHIMEGLPVTHIPMLAFEGKCDVVVMCVGSHNNEPGEPRELVMGGVAERVFQYISIPLLIVH